MAEDDGTTTTDPAPDADETAIAAEVDEITRSPQDQQADKVKGALIAAKRSEKALSRRLKEVEPIAARSQEIEQQLASAGPIINAILSSPQLRAEALRLAGGAPPRHADPEAVDDDPDAASLATDLGLFLADQVTPNVAAARKILTRLDQRHGRQTDERIRPLAGVTLSQKADANLREVMAMTDDDGVPMATTESIREVAQQLPAQLLADPKVVDLVLNSAIGLDRRHKRTPKVPSEPLFLERQGGNRRPVEDRISADERRAFQKVGLTEEEYKAAGKKLSEAGAGRRGIELGGRS